MVDLPRRVAPVHARTLLALSAALVLGIAGCGEEALGPGTDGDPAPGTEAATGVPTEVRDDPGTVAALVASAAGANFGVVYELREGHEVVSIFRVDSAPPRFALAEGDAEAGVVHIRTGDRETIACGGGGDIWTCMHHEDPDDELGAAGWVATAIDPAADLGAEEAWVSAGHREIAARSAVCGRGEMLAEEVEEVCLDEELGLPLWVRYDTGRELEAVEVGPPDAAAFEPPDEPVDASG